MPASNHDLPAWLKACNLDQLAAWTTSSYMLSHLVQGNLATLQLFSSESHYVRALWHALLVP